MAERLFEAPGDGGSPGTAEPACPVEPLWSLRQGRHEIEAQLWNHGKFGVEGRLLRDGELLTGRRFDTWSLAEQFLDDERRELLRQGWTPSTAVAEAEHLVRLLMAQETRVHAWFKYLIGVEGAMVLILALILRPVELGQPLDPGLRLVASFGIPLFGVLFAVAMARIIVIEQRWAGWYAQRLKNPKLSPTVMPGAADLARQGAGSVGRLAIALAVLLVLGWIAIAGALAPWRLLIRIYPM
jgi:hypothetical protein